MDRTFIHILMDRSVPIKGHKRVAKSRISAKEAYLKVEKELKRLNGHIRKKLISDEHLGNTIFQNLRRELTPAERDTVINDHFTAAYYSFIKLREIMIKEHYFDYRGIKKYGYIINTML